MHHNNEEANKIYDEVDQKMDSWRRAHWQVYSQLVTSSPLIPLLRFVFLFREARGNAELTKH